MVRELDEITTPTLRERLERGIVRNLINAKANFGLGIKKTARLHKMDRQTGRRTSQTGN